MGTKPHFWFMHGKWCCAQRQLSDTSRGGYGTGATPKAAFASWWFRHLL